MSKGKVIVLGVNGHIGRAVARAFVAGGWDVTGMARSDRHRLPGGRDRLRARHCPGGVGWPRHWCGPLGGRRLWYARSR